MKALFIILLLVGAHAEQNHHGGVAEPEPGSEGEPLAEPEEEEYKKEQRCIVTPRGLRLINRPVLRSENEEVTQQVTSVRSCIHKCMGSNPPCQSLTHRSFPSGSQLCEYRFPGVPEERRLGARVGERRIQFNFTTIDNCHRNNSFWNEWRAWSPCSERCGGGFKVRQRTCNPLTVDNYWDRLDLSCAFVEREGCNKDVDCKNLPKESEDDFGETTQVPKQSPLVSSEKRLSSAVTRTINHRVTGLGFCVRACRILGPACKAVAYRKYLIAKLAPECVIYGEDMSDGARLVPAPMSQGEEWRLVQFLDSRLMAEWQEWGECSESCGDEGVRSRVREGVGFIGNTTINFTEKINEVCYEHKWNCSPKITLN